ncbi:conjugal transfer mating pair stabilization protein TraN [Sphingobium sp. AP50]|uniref:conjugal transfer protein TraN n=1 Tax=Sphingobium sp. AP50 TaxID=1884369 RepID=UPI0008D73B46|nr:conjugal transfer mating pair stabilization protein TraN [Sphingobium sp. AP50]
MKRLVLLPILLCIAIPTPAQMTAPQAREEGKALGSAMRSDEHWIPKDDAQAAIVPGYQGTDLPEAQYYGEPDKLANDGNALKSSSDVYKITTDTSKTRPIFSTDEIRAVTANASAIENDPSTQLGGEAISAGSGECQPLPAENAQIYYDATCDTGVVVSSVPLETIYSCPPGWTLDGATCTTTETIPASIIYSCDADWTLDGSQCAKTQPANVSAYSCPAGWALNGSRCSRTLTQGADQFGSSCPDDHSLTGTICQAIITIEATPTYACPIDFSLSGAICVRNFSYEATATSSCELGWALDGVSCTRQVSQPATESYACPSGYSLDEGTCSQSANYEATATYSCPDGGTVEGNQCVTTNTTSATPAYACPYYYYNEGSMFGGGGPYCVMRKAEFASSKCAATRTDPGSIEFLREQKSSGSTFCLYKPLRTYTCPSAAWNFDPQYNQCVSNVVQDGIVTYTCPQAGDLQGTTCYRTYVTGATVTYACPADYNLSGQTCVKSEYRQANVHYSCPSGGTLSGSACQANEQIAASVSYACPAGYSLNGTTCSRTDDVPGTPVYSCPTGYSLSGTTCTKTEEQAATPIYACPTGFVLSGSQCTGTVAAKPIYYCPANFTLSGQSCSQTHSQPATSHQQCPKDANTNLDGSCYTEDQQDDCGTLQGNPQCSWQYDNCLDENPTSDGCKMTERVFRCPVSGATVAQPPKYVCGDDVYCINGDCEAINREASSEFKDALTALHAIDTAGKDFDPDDMHVFPGTRDTCHKPIFGVVNCCAGKVSGLLPLGIGGAALAGAISGNVAALSGVATQFLTTFLCSTDEKMLDVKDRMGFCTFIGSYCSSSILGVCTTKRKTYCCFESKLSRILQEQGRPQINKPFGKPKAEQCEGFTVDEFSRLDLSVMDFTDVYSDFMDTARMPDEVETMTDIQQKIQDYYELHSQ